MLLEGSIAFLKEQINKKDTVTDSLLNQLLKKNKLTPQNKTSNNKAKTVSIQTEARTDLKLAESSKQTKSGSTEKLQNGKKNTAYISLK